MKMWIGAFGEIKNIVTHWMPLPAPPDRRPQERQEDTRWTTTGDLSCTIVTGSLWGEVEQVRHAHWENTGGNEKVGLAYGTCSHCHREAWANYELTPRCPYCGAHMDGVKS